MDQEQQGFGKDYSEDSFWGKIKKYAKAAGVEVIEKALQLYYALQNANTPAWAKTVIVGALGYFISPIDAIPDITPLIGYGDDLGVLAAAIAMVSTHITDDIKEKATTKSKEWFGK